MANFPFRDTTLPLEVRIEDLLTRLSVEEKVSQLCNSASAVAGLSLPAYNWWNEALHGVARAGTATVFPQAIALAAMFDDQLLEEIAAAIAEEARAKYNLAQKKKDTGAYKGLTFWSPNINILRDPRWGRGHETYGEDPFLTSRLGVAFIKGLQQRDSSGKLKTAACAKHFAAHSGPEGKRHSFNAEVSKKDLFETYLPAFEAAVKEGQVEAVMGAYNALNGTPCCCNAELLNGILREKWGFQGHVVSDCGAIDDIHRGHRTTRSAKESSALALKNGCDLNCGKTYQHLIDSYEADLIDENDLDTALRRLLRARFLLGMFDQPGSGAYDAIGEDVVACAEHKALALRAAERAAVLLANNGILPLEAGKLKKVAVIGPNADSRSVLLGNYNGTPTEYSTALEGLSNYLGTDKVIYAKGCRLFGRNSERLLREAERAALAADVVIACVGLDPSLEGEQGDAFNSDGSGDKTSLGIPPCQETLLQRLKATGKPVVAVLNTGSSVSVQTPGLDALLNMWYPGEQGGAALARLLFGDASPCGRLPMTFYRSVDDLPDFEDYSMRGRTYRYFEGEPLYPFGSGLTYTRFDYSNLKAERNSGGGAEVSLTLRNARERDARETVQVFVRALDTIIGQPRKSLKAFRGIFLRAGEEARVSFALAAEAFMFIDDEGEPYAPDCGFAVEAGPLTARVE